MGLRFCLVTTFFPPEHFGGDAIFVSQLANMLAGAGHEVDVVHCVDSFKLVNTVSGTSPAPRHPSIQVHRLESAFGALSPLATYATGMPWLKPLERILSDGFDVIHWHNASLIGGVGAMALGKAVKLCTLHDYWWICPTNVLFRYNKEPCTKRTCWRCSISYGRPPQFWRTDNRIAQAAQHIDRFLAPSSYARERFLRAGFPFAPSVLPHFLAPAERAAKPAHPSYYFFAGRLEKLKGLQTILPLFRGRRLVVAGAGSYGDELQRQAKGLDVEFLGRVAHDRIAQLYAGAIATLVPSICEETFGLTILESLGQGTPPIVSSFGALPETVAAAGAGFVYRDLNELERILATLDREPATAAVANLAPFDPQLHLARYLAIIEDSSRSVLARVAAVSV